MDRSIILITNDDGIDSDGLRRLALCAREHGEVWVIAPDGQRSAMSHSINLREPITVRPVAYPVEHVHAYACSGTPADCIRLGLHNILPQKPDYVFSGINYGYNTGSDIQYSATVGAGLEAAWSGIHTVAFSENASPVHEVTEAYLPQLMDRMMHEPLGYNEIWNVNFPGLPLSECKGILEDRQVADCAFYRDSYDEEAQADGSIRYHVNGRYSEDAPEGTDYRAIVDGYISIGKVRNLRA